MFAHSECFYLAFSSPANMEKTICSSRGRFLPISDKAVEWDLSAKVPDTTGSG